MLARSDPAPSPGSGQIMTWTPDVRQCCGMPASSAASTRSASVPSPRRSGSSRRRRRFESPAEAWVGKKPGYAARFFLLGKNLELKFIDHTDREHIDVTLTSRAFLAHLREHLIFRPAGPLLRERVLSSDAEA